MKPSLHTLAFSIIAAWLCPLAATSEIVTFNFTGTVRWVYNPHGVVDPSLITVGDPVQLSLRYDTTTPDHYPDDATRGTFVSPGWLKVSVNGLDFERTTTVQVDVLHGYNGGQESFSAMAYPDVTVWPASMPMYPYQRILMQVSETVPPYDFLANAELPTSLDFSRANRRIGTVGTSTSSTNMYEFQFDFVQVPAPRVVCHPSITVSNDAGLCLAVVTAAQVDNGSYDPRGGPLTLSLAPPPPYSVGSHTVTFTAMATNGLSTSTNVVIRVVDTEPPVIVCASNKVVECVTAWDFDPAFAFDNCNATNVFVSVVSTVTNVGCCGTFTATRTWQAADNATNTATCSQTVIVVDTTPPTIMCTASMALEFQDENGALASYVITAGDTCSSISLAVTPASGSMFPIGVTPVQATATDSCTNSAQCAFDVTVLGAKGVKSNVLAELTALRADVTNFLDSWELGEAIRHLSCALATNLWVDQTHVVRRGGNLIFLGEEATLWELRQMLWWNRGGVPRETLQDFIDRLVRCDRLLAVVSIQDAARTGAKPRRVAEAWKEVARGDRDAAQGWPILAVAHYWNAWNWALHLRVNLAPAPGGGMVQMQFVGDTSQTYVVQASTNLVDWVTVGTCTADADGNAEYTDADAARYPARFYRVVEQ